ncbi:hypothetical protein MASSI9I_10205 [Massilia sp. 9I]|nr:hypothetical protein MASSI9I_10205 [Massilia sp. 9I]
MGSNPTLSAKKMKRAPHGALFIFLAERRELLRSSRVGFEASRMLARGRPAERGRIPPVSSRACLCF